MKQVLVRTAFCLMLVSLSGFLPAQSIAVKNKLVLHSQQKKNKASDKNIDAQNFLLVYAGELMTGALYIKILKSDHSLKAVLLDKKQHTLWEVPVASEHITISSSKNFFVVASNANNPNHLHEDGRIQLKGFTCYDSSGNIISSVPNTAFISQVFIAQNSQIVLLTQNGLESYDTMGRRTWNFESRLASAEPEGDGNFIKTMQGNLSNNQFQLHLIDAGKGLVIQSWDYLYGNELRLMHINTEKNWLLMTVENGNDWSLNLVDMKTWTVIATVNGLQSGIFSPVWNAKDQCYGFLFYKGKSHDSAVPALGIVDCKDFSLESVEIGLKKFDLNNDHLKLLQEQNLYSITTAGSVKNYQLK